MIAKFLQSLLDATSRVLMLGLELLGRMPGVRYPRFISLGYRAKRAFKTYEREQATALARELLLIAEEYREDWHYGNALHQAHLVLGWVALSQGDLATARSELLCAGRVPGSPQLNSFGPSMGLAKEMLQAGQHEAVLEYLDLCRKFWAIGVERLDQWTVDVRDSRMPHFGPNERY